MKENDGDGIRGRQDHKYSLHHCHQIRMLASVELAGRLKGHF
jgi:hypothetical protein